MQSFYVDITKCRTAEKDLAACEGDLKSASRKLDSAADGLKGMSGALSMVGQSVEHLSDEAKIESKEVEQLRQALHNILDLYYNQEAGLIGQAVGNGVQSIINSVGQTIQDRVQDIASIIGQGAEAIMEHIRNNVYEDLDFIMRTATGFTDSDYWAAYFNQMRDNIMGDFGGIINLATNGWDIIFSEDGRYVEYIVDLIQGNEIDTDYYEFLNADGNFDFGEFLEGEFVPDFEMNHSTLGNVLKWGGKIIDGLDYASIIGEDFMDVIYNEDTRQCEWSLQNIGYFTSDVIVDEVATFGCNFLGDLAGGAVASAVATIPYAGVVLAPIADFAVSTLVSNTAEFAINLDLPFDLNGDGEFDSAVDMAKIIGREGVDNIIAVGEFVVESAYDYMSTNHPELTQAISDTISPIVDAGQEFLDGAADTFDNILNAGLDFEESAKDYVGNLFESGLETAGNNLQNGVEYVSSQIGNLADFAGDVMHGEGLDAVGEYVSESIDNGFTYAENLVDNFAESAGDFLSNTADFAQDCLSILGWS